MIGQSEKRIKNKDCHQNHITKLTHATSLCSNGQRCFQMANALSHKPYGDIL